jgi:hypothetical protein
VLISKKLVAGKAMAASISSGMTTRRVALKVGMRRKVLFEIVIGRFIVLVLS